MAHVTVMPRGPRRVARHDEQNVRARLLTFAFVDQSDIPYLNETTLNKDVYAK